MADINIKGADHKVEALNAAVPQAGDIVTKLQRDLVGRGVRKRRAAGLLAAAVDEFLADEDFATDADVASQLMGAVNRDDTAENIADFLARSLDARGRGNLVRLEDFLRGFVEERLEEEER